MKTLLAALAVVLALPAYAQPVATVTAGKATITLYTEPCGTKNISNLPQRAVWNEGEKVFEGCWGPSQFGVVMTYWDDGSVAVIPFEAFVRTGPSI